MPVIASRIIIGLSIAASLFIGMLSGYALHRVPHRYEIDTALGCVETIITDEKNQDGYGSYMAFKDDIAPGHGAKNQAILTVRALIGGLNSGGIGDHVRVCLLDTPSKDKGCNPDEDIRGRHFIIYDRASGNVGDYSSDIHPCGSPM